MKMPVPSLGSLSPWSYLNRKSLPGKDLYSVSSATSWFGVCHRGMTAGSVFLSLYCGFLFFVGLGDRDLLSSHEARAAQDAQTILSDGTWLLPRLFDGHIELQKPPLYYWLVAILGKILN